MRVATKLIPLQLGEGLEFDSEVQALEEDGRLVVAATSRVAPDGSPLIRLVGEADALLSVLQDGWFMTYDEAIAYLEQ